MNQTEKEKLITEVVSLLQTRLNAMTTAPTAAVEPKSEPLEMLTVQECSQAVKGLSVHTVRQLIAQGKIPSIRTGQGKGGKILVSRAALLRYFESGGV